MQPIKVVFLGLYFEAWDALDEIYRIMLADPRFEPIVISLPRKLTGALRYAEEEKAHAFFDSKGIQHIRFNFGGDGSDNQEVLEKLRELAPDYVFVNYPWQRNYQPAIRFDRLIEFTRLAYVPYFSLAMIEEPDHEPGGGQGDSPAATHLYRQRLHQIASLVFTQDRFVKEAYENTERGGDYVHFVGSPKIDALRREAEQESGSWPILGEGFRMVWAPHHSYSPHWLNFGMFKEVRDEMLVLAKSDPSLQIVLRPHPFLWGTLTDRNVISEQELSSWRSEWDSLPNTFVDEDGSYGELFLATDLLVTDGISFLGEYPLVTAKPAVFLEKEDHWKFSPIGELAAEASIRISSFEQLLTTIASARVGLLPDRDEAITALIEQSSPYPGESATRIVELVYNDFANGPSELVSPDITSEIPWEFAPGREKFED